MINAYFSQILDTFKEAICVTDRSGTILFVNPQHSRLTGIPRDRIIGMSVNDTVRSGMFDVVLNPEIVRTRQPVTRVQQVSNGRTLVLDGTPVLDEQGNVILVVTIIRDVTTVMEMRAQLSSQNELLETFRQLSAPKGERTAKIPRIIHSTAMRRIYGQASVIADTDATVLLLGDTGVGKDVLARNVHSLSGRSGAFVKADCGSIPENLIETELFGYAPGTFSGANKSGKMGLIEAASSGTLFLDEIGELPYPMQSRLLRVMQDKEIMRVGSTSPKKVDVRIVAATNRDLEQEVAAGRFRSDLYYRLKVAVLHIPSLRERQADILPLAQSFLHFYCRKYNRSVQLGEDVEQILLAYDWPGNVRELENLIQSLVVTVQKKIIEARDLPIARAPSSPEDAVLHELDDMFDPKGDESLKDIIKRLESKVLSCALKRYGTISEVAKHLDVDRSTVFRKLKAAEGREE